MIPPTDETSARPQPSTNVRNYRTAPARQPRLTKVLRTVFQRLLKADIAQHDQFEVLRVCRDYLVGVLRLGDGTHTGAAEGWSGGRSAFLANNNGRRRKQCTR
jgi:hypothetical protein